MLLWQHQKQKMCPQADATVGLYSMLMQMGHDQFSSSSIGDVHMVLSSCCLEAQQELERTANSAHHALGRALAQLQLVKTHSSTPLLQHSDFLKQ